MKCGQAHGDAYFGNLGYHAAKTNQTERRKNEVFEEYVPSDYHRKIKSRKNKALTDFV